MSEDRKKPGVAFWATVGLVVALVGYPLSFGPACWLVHRECISPETAAIVYKPLIWVVFCGPKLTGTALRGYCEYFAPPIIRRVMPSKGHVYEYRNGVLEQIRPAD